MSNHVYILLFEELLIYTSSEQWSARSFGTSELKYPMSLILFYQKKKKNGGCKSNFVFFSAKEFVFARAVEKICFLVLPNCPSLYIQALFTFIWW